jgi:hypothetical protein
MLRVVFAPTDGLHEARWPFLALQQKRIETLPV